ncbi:UNVERIFIED_CONTAM: hypothetical protein FKN15_075347 [Acipenser sinensis]
MSDVDLRKIGVNVLKNVNSGESVELQSLWQDRSVVLFFLRRFGCQVCRWTAAEVSKLKEDLSENGVALVGVGPEEAGLQEFQEGGYFKGGGEKVLLHFVQDSPGDHVPLETIIQTLGIQAKVQPGQRPEHKKIKEGSQPRGVRSLRGNAAFRNSPTRSEPRTASEPDRVP